jgi:hypothetical protein
MTALKDLIRDNWLGLTVLAVVATLAGVFFRSMSHRRGGTAERAARLPASPGEGALSLADELKRFRLSTLIFRGPVNRIDDDDLDLALGWNQLQPQLLLQRL